MIKYRVYDTRAKKYLDRKAVCIDGNGVLKVGKHVLGDTIRIPHSRKSPMFIIEQYTGLEDKNGVEIAAGDIVKRRTANYEKQVFEDEYGVVEYETGSFYVDFRGDIDSLMLRYGEPEVIGNIHKNADLLKGQHEL